MAEAANSRPGLVLARTAAEAEAAFVDTGAEKSHRPTRSRAAALNRNINVSKLCQKKRFTEISWSNPG